MKSRSLACAAALLWPLFTPLAAETTTPVASGAATAPAAASTEDAIKTELSTLVERVKVKLQAGNTTEAALADELKGFDALLAKYSAEKSDPVAMIGFMKAMLYLQVLEKQEAGVAMLRQIVKDFPGTQVAGRIPEMITEIEETAAAESLTAVGKTFAPFKETATDGTVVDLAAYQGKIVLVDFWATWCGPCVDELPHVRAAYEKYHAQGFEVIGISLDRDGAALADFTKKNQMAWPQLFDGLGWKNKLAQAYGIRSIPATFLLDREGKIVAKGLRGDALSLKIGELLAPAP